MPAQSKSEGELAYVKSQALKGFENCGGRSTFQSGHRDASRPPSQLFWEVLEWPRDFWDKVGVWGQSQLREVGLAGMGKRAGYSDPPPLLPLPVYLPLCHFPIPRGAQDTLPTSPT